MQKGGVNRSHRTSVNRLKTQRSSKRVRGKGTGTQIVNLRLLHWRLLLVWGFLLICVVGLAVNLYQLQIVRATELLGKARSQQMTYLRPFIPRRPIVDRNDDVLAVDQPVYTLYVHPKLFKESKEEIATKLAKIINRPSADLVKQFNTRPSGIRIAPALSEEIAAQVEKLNTNGLELIQQYSRLYPQQELDGNVVGYVDLDRRAQAGVEYSQEKMLERPAQNLRLSRAGNGTFMSAYTPKGFLHIDDLQLQLTIDNRLQRAARFALRKQLQSFSAKRGTVMVMDVQDGSLLTMVSEPSYDPNEYYKSDVRLFKNWALSDLYEPGSTFKPLNVAIALETGAIKPDNVFYDSGQIKVGGWRIKNAEGGHEGPLTIAQILQYSSNIGMVQIIQKMQPANYYSWLQRLGLGQPVGIDLPFETHSQLKSQKQFVASPIEPATASFGQGFSLTPIKLLQLHAALANGGKLVTPHVVRGLLDSKGKLHWQPKLPEPRSVFSQKTTQTVVKMMETVVEEGTGVLAQIPGYRIAGKTGTAQKAGPQGGYYSGAKITSFVGIIPVASPRYVVLAVIDEPKGNVFGSTTAAPVVKSVMDALATIEEIPPTEPIVKPTKCPEGKDKC